VDAKKDAKRSTETTARGKQRAGVEKCGKVSKMRVKAPFLQFVCDAMSKYIASYKNNKMETTTATKTAHDEEEEEQWQKVTKKMKMKNQKKNS